MACEALVKELNKELAYPPMTGRVIKIEGNKAYINIGTNDGMNGDMLYEYVIPGDSAPADAAAEVQGAGNTNAAEATAEDEPDKQPAATNSDADKPLAATVEDAPKPDDSLFVIDAISRLGMFDYNNEYMFTIATGAPLSMYGSYSIISIMKLPDTTNSITPLMLVREAKTR
jgi:hypothetical protein